MQKSGKIGYGLIYNSFFLLILPLLKLFAGIAAWSDGLFVLAAAIMIGVGVILIGRQSKATATGMRVIRMDPFVLGRDRLARNMLAGAMVWFNIYFLVASNLFTNPRAKPDSWSFFNNIAFVVLGAAWLLLLTSPSDRRPEYPEETGQPT